MRVNPPRACIDIDDSRYPDLLRQTDDPPKSLYVMGDPLILSRPSVSIVGARRATPYGLECARIFATWASTVGLTVVSGGATGCDQAAHAAALDADGPTVAVMGCGADIAYPRAAADLFDLIARTGCVVSELPWGTPPQRWAFRRRNRIIAGLSQALVVVEAGLPSGTFSTADHALDASRDVLVVPGSIFSPESAGCNRLIRQGAYALTDVSDLAGVVGGLCDGERAVLSCSGDLEHNEVYVAVRANPARPDDLGRSLGMDIVDVARALGSLEISGHVSRYRDGRYGLSFGEKGN